VEGVLLGIEMVLPASKYRLPRFNMPFELGVFLGARHYG